MSKKNEIIKVPFYGNELITIEKDGKIYVAMKNIVEALGLTWRDQQRIIENDPVLNSVKGVTPLTGSDGKQYEMICLPLEYLNGWLFKVPASRYKGKRREAIIRYQKECYQALYNYFHNGAAINPFVDAEKLIAFFEKATATFERQDEMIREQQKLIDSVTSDSVYGEVSEVTGEPKCVLVRQHFRSYAPPKKKKSRSPMQMVFNFLKGGAAHAERS